jgi:hypothetical protein
VDSCQQPKRAFGIIWLMLALRAGGHEPRRPSYLRIGCSGLSQMDGAGLEQASRFRVCSFGCGNGLIGP